MSKTADSAALRLRRGQVLDLADDDPMLLFLASMVWGFGRVGRKFRVQEALGLRVPRGWSGPIGKVDAEDRIGTIWELSRRDPLEAFTLYMSPAGELKLPGIAISFITKFLYFAGFETNRARGGPVPLIMDNNVASALGYRSAAPFASPGRYREYLDLAHELAGGQRPDLVEYALFDIGRRRNEDADP